MRTTLLILLTALFGGNGIATAAEDEGSIQRGQAKAFYCTGCHGYNGMGTAAAPPLAGKDEAELRSRLISFKQKKSSIMGLQLARFNETDLKDLAAYFASLKSTPTGRASYERDIEPIIQWRCITCHSAGGEGARKSGLDLSSYKALMQGTREGGELIVPGSPETSSFMVMVTRKDHLRMPFGASPLADDEIRVLRTWIEQGAKNN